MEITLEKIELVKDRTGVSYKEAKEALEAANGSVVDAIVAIEEMIDHKSGSKVSEHGAQLMDKIISNAVDFADPEHPVRVNCNEDTGEAAISVSNHGPCLDLHMKDRIFDSMVSVRSQSRKKLPHLGMGLHIARMITEYHGGYIYADNLLGGDGVIVVVRLPLYKP